MTLARGSLLLFVTCLELVGCTPVAQNWRLGSFTSAGFQHAALSYTVAYGDSKAGQILSGDWRIENFFVDERGRRKPKRAPESFETVPIDDGAGHIRRRQLYKRDLSLVHEGSGAVIWISSIPLQRTLAETDLFELARKYEKAAAAVGYPTIDLAKGSAVQKHSIRVLDAQDARVDGVKGFETTFELTSVRDSEDVRDARIVLLKPPFAWKIDGADHAVLLVVGYASSPGDCVHHLPDFERLVNQLDVAPGTTKYKTGVFDPTRAPPQAIVDQASQSAPMPDAPPEAEAQLRPFLDARKDDILACANVDRVALVADYGDGQLRVSIRGQPEGSAEEACVRHVLRDLSPPVGKGRVVHVLSR